MTILGTLVRRWPREAEPKSCPTGWTGCAANGTTPVFNRDAAKIQTETGLALLLFALRKFFEEGPDHVWWHPWSLVVHGDQHVCPCLLQSHRDERT